MSSCYVYIMAMRDRGDNGRDYVKVGISSKPETRRQAIQTGCPDVVEMPFTYRLPSREDARWVEQEFHRENGHRRLSGEWFNEYAVGAAGNVISLLVRCWLEKHRGEVEWLPGWLQSAGLAQEAIPDVMAEYGI